MIPFIMPKHVLDDLIAWKCRKIIYEKYGDGGKRMSKGGQFKTSTLITIIHWSRLNY